MKNNTEKDSIINEFKKVGFSNYYMQMFDKDCDLDKRIYLMLKFLGMDQSYSGFAYVTDAIKLILETPSIKLQGVYDIIAEKQHKKSASIERCIRTSRLQCMEQINPELRFVIFGSSSKEFTNGAFLWGMANFIEYEIC